MRWLVIELTNGLTKLASLGLAWTPAHDVIEVTVGTWLEALSVGRSWDQERDTPRIRAAFVTLATSRENWPQPKHFIEALPPSTQLRLVGNERPTDSPELRAVMFGADAAEVLGKKQPPYGGDRKSAAGGDA